MAAKNDIEVGQKVMVPMRGMCRVVSIEEETILGQKLSLVHLKPARGKGIIKVPAHQLEGQGVRPLVSKEEMLRVLEQEVEVPDVRDEDSYDRSARWSEMLKSEDCATRFQVLREVSSLPESELSPQEKKFKKQVRLAARQEIESALSTSAAGAGRRLNLALGE